MVMKTFKEFLAENNMGMPQPGAAPTPPMGGGEDPNVQKKMTMLQRLLADLKELKDIPQHVGAMMNDLFDEISNGFPSM